MMVQYFYNLDYCKTTPESNSDRSHDDLCQTTEEHSDSGDIPDILLHAKVYAIAEKYAINGLKSLARANFGTTALRCWDTDDFLNAIDEAYTSTLDSDRGLRDIVLKVLAGHEELLDRDEMKKLLRRLGSLAYDLVMHYHQQKDKPDVG
ncbi:homology to btb poz domain-containing protein [Colletotrichum incanum]|nr:homology to btb poz domain-containing protein [Colletotrichum incanum]